jgi:hypothetical protein
MSEPRRVLERAIECWNAGDRDAWAKLYAEDVVYEAPGGQRIFGMFNSPRMNDRRTYTNPLLSVDIAFLARDPLRWR